MSETLYQPIDGSKNQIRVLRLLRDHEITDSLYQNMIELEMKVISLDDWKDTSRGLMEKFGLDVLTREELSKELLFKAIGSDQVSLWNAEEKAAQLLKLRKVHEEYVSSKDFGRWQWGDYLTLSYVWGEASSTKKIVVNNCVMDVTRNLFRFLERSWAAREDEIPQGRLWLWIDAICINQQDVAERNEQVKRMGHIYSLSRACCAWLGEAPEDHGKAIKLLETIGNQPINTLTEAKAYMESICDRDSDQFEAGTWLALSALLDNPYWWRLWIMQEVALSRNEIPIFWGHLADTVLAWPWVRDSILIMSHAKEEVRSALERDTNRSTDTNENTRRMNSDFLSNLSRIMMLASLTHPKDTGRPCPNLGMLLLVSRISKQSDDRDKVYGVVSLLDPRISELISPHYESSVEQVYIDFTRAVITVTESLDIIFESRSLTAQRYLPSWVPDLREQPVSKQPLTVKVPYNANKSEKRLPLFRDQALIFDGFVVDYIDGLGAIPGCSEWPFQEMVLPQYRTSAYTHEGTQEALWRTLLANRTGNGEVAPDGWAGILRFPRKPIRRDHHMIMMSRDYYVMVRDANSSFLIGGHTFDHYFNSSEPNDSDSDYLGKLDGFVAELTAEGWIEPIVQRLCNVLATRRLITTHEGYLGLVVDEAKQGDAIVIAFGASTPMIMRFNEETKEWKFIGEAYIHGLMEGEAMDMLEGRFKVETFEVS